MSSVVDRKLACDEQGYPCHACLDDIGICGCVADCGALQCTGAWVEGVSPGNVAERFTAEGSVFSMQSKLKDDPAEQCLCCRPHGHVFCYGIHMTGEAGRPRPGYEHVSPDDWMHRLLTPYRFRPGLKVRVTLEILED